MPTQTSKKSSTASKPKAQTKRSSAADESRRDQARSVVETAVDLPVGAALEVSDRLSELVEPFTDRTSAEKRFGTYRTRLRRTVKRTERRGTTARRRATNEARKAVEDQASRAQDLVAQLR